MNGGGWIFEMPQRQLFTGLIQQLLKRGALGLQFSLQLTHANGKLTSDRLNGGQFSGELSSDRLDDPLGVAVGLIDIVQHRLSMLLKEGQQRWITR